VLPDQVNDHVPESAATSRFQKTSMLPRDAAVVFATAFDVKPAGGVTAAVDSLYSRTTAISPMVAPAGTGTAALAALDPARGVPAARKATGQEARA
jgi:hypothetical protein